MKLLAIADLHDSNFYIEKLKKREESRDYDALLMCGDIATAEDIAEKVISAIRGKAYYVPGNGESARILELFEEAGLSIHGKTEVLGSWKVAGFGMCEPTPFGTPGELPSEEMYARMARMDIDERTILLTHCPPKGVLDRGFGCEAVRRIIEEKSPAYNLFGHIHEVADVERVGETTCINCPPAMRGGAVMLSPDEGRVEFVEL